MQAPGSLLPEYENPPVIEVIFGVQFKELGKLKAPHIGTFWDKIDRKKYPDCEEMPSLMHIIEQYDQPKPPLSIQSFDVPPLPRHFFITKEKNHLIQIQRDRLLLNWRKLGKGTAYPRYSTLLPRFLECWNDFNGLAEELQVGPVEPDQYELTYINHIPKGEGWDSLRDIEGVHPGFKCDTEDRFLPEPEEVAWRRIYRFAEDAGRLYASMQQAVDKETGNPILVLNLTARGICKDGLECWLNMAHEWIVRGFTDLTGPKIQESIWKRTR